MPDERLLFSASDDRTVRAWDVVTHRCVWHTSPPNKTCGTMRSLAITEAHLFVGSSNGTLYVYSIDGESRLTHHKHRKKMEAQARERAAALIERLGRGGGRAQAAAAAAAAAQRAAEAAAAQPAFDFTLETELNHGGVPINSLAVGGVDGGVDYIFSASEDGSIKVFAIPDEDLDFAPLQHFSHHTLSINAVMCSYNYVMTVSDDMTLRIYTMSRVEDWEHELERKVSVGARIKSAHLAPAASEYGGGHLLLGLNIGRCLICPVGGTI